MNAAQWTKIGPVLEVVKGQKWPAGEHGVYTATREPGDWSDYGVAMGNELTAGRFAFAVDVDPRNGGAATWAALIAQHGELPATVTNDILACVPSFDPRTRDQGAQSTAVGRGLATQLRTQRTMIAVHASGHRRSDGEPHRTRASREDARLVPLPVDVVDHRRTLAR
jgi:hypothetical protein